MSSPETTPVKPEGSGVHSETMLVKREVFRVLFETTPVKKEDVHVSFEPAPVKRGGSPCRSGGRRVGETWFTG